MICSQEINLNKLNLITKKRGAKMKKLFLFCFVLLFITNAGSIFAQLTGQIPLDGATLDKYVDPLPNFANNRVNGILPLTITMKEFQQKVLPSTFNYPAPYTGTYVWGYEIKNGLKTYGPNYPAWSINAYRGIPTRIKYVNELGTATTPPFLQQYLYVDQSIHWANPYNLGMMDPARMDRYIGPAPAVVHLHGGEVPSAYDGGPDAWFTPGPAGTRKVGKGFVSDQYVYPNTQQAATLWYHDHTLGATRLNVYAGLAGFYLLRDVFNEPFNLPSGSQEIEIAIQDRMFDTNGQWYFPNIGVNAEHPFWIPEFFGDVMVVNGKAWPYLNVEPRRYRFRVLNGCNARFLSMWLVDTTGALGPNVWQIGSDGGLLDNPVSIPSSSKLFLAPGERADIIIDFAKLAGKVFILRNDANVPYPDGDPVNPNTDGQVMKFNVSLPLKGIDLSYNPVKNFPPLRMFGKVIKLDPAVTGVAPAVKRQLTLKEVSSPLTGNPLEVLVNNTGWDGLRSDMMTPVPGSKLINGTYMTELPQVGATEVWQIINLTMDAHPIHLHLVQFQIISRQQFDPAYSDLYNSSFPGGQYIAAYGPPFTYNVQNADGAIGGNPAVSPYLIGVPAPPNENEKGWKDTFKMFPGEVTTVVVRLAPQDVKVNKNLAGKNKFDFDPTIPLGQKDRWGYPGGEGYVWHCHIIDHEDNEMMRPYMVMNTQQDIFLGKQYADNSINANNLSFALNQNYPNPFNPVTQISFSIPQSGNVKLTVYNVLGQAAKTLVNEFREAGQYQVTFNAAELSSGMYLYKLETGNYTDIKKMIVLK